MKQLFSVIIFIAVLFSTPGCILGPSIKGNGEVTDERRNITGFDKIKTSTGLDVFLIPDSVEYVVVEADENLHTTIKTELDGETLEIRSDKQIHWARSRKVTVHFSKLTELRSTSGSSLSSLGIIHSKSLEIAASSGARQHLEVDAEHFSGRSSSGAQVELKGKTVYAELKASSGAHLKGKDLEAVTCTANVSSGAHIWTWVKNDLDASASSGGHIYYTGDPEKININTSSGGAVKKD